MHAWRLECEAPGIHPTTNDRLDYLAKPTSQYRIQPLISTAPHQSSTLAEHSICHELTWEDIMLPTDVVPENPCPSRPDHSHWVYCTVLYCTVGVGVTIWAGYCLALLIDVLIYISILAGTVVCLCWIALLGFRLVVWLVFCVLFSMAAPGCFAG